MIKSLAILIYTITLLPGRVHVSIANTEQQAFKMPRWTPGYYQYISFPERVSNFKGDKNTIEYDVQADSNFVAAAYVDNDRALLNLTGICMHPEKLKQAVLLKVITPDGWSVATGMDKKGDYYTAPDFDILYDSRPFGGDGISYYDKGPLIALLLDLQIRQATKNKRCLDDVMRGLYKKYYQQLQRGYTENEFQQMCEDVAGIKLTELFQYASTTKEVDYNKYLAYAGLKLEPKTYEFTRLEHSDTMQQKIYNSIF